MLLLESRVQLSTLSNMDEGNLDRVGKAAKNLREAIDESDLPEKKKSTSKNKLYDLTREVFHDSKEDKALK